MIITTSIHIKVPICKSSSASYIRPLFNFGSFPASCHWSCDHCAWFWVSVLRLRPSKANKTTAQNQHRIHRCDSFSYQIVYTDLIICYLESPNKTQIIWQEIRSWASCTYAQFRLAGEQFDYVRFICKSWLTHHLLLFVTSVGLYFSFVWHGWVPVDVVYYLRVNPYQHYSFNIMLTT